MAVADLLGVRVARKTLLAVAGLVSVHDRTWTTGRARAVQRWSELEPDLATHLSRLHSWAQRERHPDCEQVGVRTRRRWNRLCDRGVLQRLIGLWTDHADDQ